MNRSSHAKRPSRLARKRRYSYQPQIDRLEQRTMLAADLNFTPLPSSANTLTASNVGTPVPFELAPEYTQTVIQRRGTTATTDPDLGALLGQNTLNESGPFTGRYLFSTAQENGTDSAGFIVGTLNRTDLATGQTINLLDIAVTDSQLPGDTFASQLTLQNLHAIRWTPWGTLLVAEAIDSTDGDFSADFDLSASDAADGIVYEIVDPTSAQPRVFARPALGSGNFQGIDIDSQGNVYYSVNRGVASAVFRFVPIGGGDSPLEFGEVSVLNTPTAPFGEAAWEFLALPGNYSLGEALDDLSAPPFRAFDNVRDVEIGIADFGELEGADETLYIAVQGANQVVALDLDGYFQDPLAPTLYNFLDNLVEPDFNDPVDLAVDASGRVYIGEAIEPPPAAFPGGVGEGNDVWVASDSATDVDAPDPLFPDEPVIDLVTLDSDDQLGRLASLKVSNSSVAGLYVNPFNNDQIYVNVSSVTAVKNQIVRFDFAAALQPSVTEIDLGNGEVLLSIVGTAKSESIIITGNNILTVRIGTQVFKGLAPSNTVVVYGLGGNDYIVASTGTFFDFTVFGGAGNDYIATGRGNDSLAGEAGHDRLLAGTGNNNLSGGADNDSLSAGNDDDVMSGDGGNDRLVSNGGNDTLLGGAGDDALVGGLDNDYLNGGAGNDNLDGYFGDDIVVGGTGNDRITGGPGTNVMIGGDGADYLFSRGGDNLYIGDITAVDNDDAGIAALFALWQMVFFSPTAGQEVYDFLDGVDGVLDGNGVTNDNKRDLLYGGNGVDLFFAFGTSDTIRYVNLGDEIFDLNNV